jgi:hypothetical protein
MKLSLPSLGGGLLFFKKNVIVLGQQINSQPDEPVFVQ